MADTLLGSFVWCELMTTDTSAAESFCGNVVGWTAVPFSPDGAYKIFNTTAGVGVAGLMQLPADAQQGGAPPHWLMYVGTPDVEATAMRIAQLGGRVITQPAEIPDGGRFAIVTDPYGAVFGIFQPPANRPGPKRGGLGDFSWFDLYTPNPDRAWTFYSAIFSWEKTSAIDMGETGLYEMFGRGGGVSNGGIMKSPPGAPAAWMPYALVKDATTAAAAAIAVGGTIVNGPREVPGGDWIAQGIDPQGAMFSVHSLKPAAKRAATKKKPAAKKQPAASNATKKKSTKNAAKVKAVARRKKPAAKKAAPKKQAKKRSAKKVARKSAKRR